jgi:ferredoxin-NADP reductase
MPFKPGQHCLVSLVDKDGFDEETRPFTFSNAPDSENVEITVKAAGDFTQAMHRLSVGDTLWMKGPLGKKLIFDESVNEDVVFLTGGSGITPFMSAMRYARSKRLPNGMTLLYSNKTPGDIIFKEELDRLGRQDQVTVWYTLTSDVPGGWGGLVGRIDARMITRYVDGLQDKVWYVCGPPPMVEGLGRVLDELGIPDSRQRIEDWQ